MYNKVYTHNACLKNNHKAEVQGIKIFSIPDWATPEIMLKIQKSKCRIILVEPYEKNINSTVSKLT